MCTKRHTRTKLLPSTWPEANSLRIQWPHPHAGWSDGRSVGIVYWGQGSISVASHKVERHLSFLWCSNHHRRPRLVVHSCDKDDDEDNNQRVVTVGEDRRRVGPRVTFHPTHQFSIHVPRRTLSALSSLYGETTFSYTHLVSQSRSRKYAVTDLKVGEFFWKFTKSICT